MPAPSSPRILPMPVPILPVSLLGDFGGHVQTLIVCNPLQSLGFKRCPPTWADAHRRRTGGEGGIRTLDTLASMPHFECGAFNHSATSPDQYLRGFKRVLLRNPLVLALIWH